MSTILRLPDIPWEYTEYLNDSQFHIILHLSRDYMMKKIFVDEHDEQTLSDITLLNIDGYTNPKKIFVDDDYQFYYLYSLYLNDHTVLEDAIELMTPEQIVQTFKQILTDMKKAHEQGFNPHDITFTNYMVNQNNEPTFIDFNYSFLNGKCANRTVDKTSYDISIFDRDRSVFTASNLNLSDKLQILKMLLGALTKKYARFDQKDIDIQKTQFELLRSMYSLTHEVELYLRNILIDCNPPKEDDYFIDDLMNPLLELTRNHK